MLPSLTNGRLVRDVAPKKMMTLVSFQLTDAMIDRPERKRENTEEEKEEKRVKQSWIVCYKHLLNLLSELDLLHFDRLSIFILDRLVRELNLSSRTQIHPLIQIQRVEFVRVRNQTIHHRS